MVDTTLPAIALVQSEPVDADAIEASLRNAGMRNPIWRYSTAEALIETLSAGKPDDGSDVAMAIVESGAWKRLTIWRAACEPHSLPVIVTFDDDHELREFNQLREAQAAGTLKPFVPKTFVRLLEPLRCRWLLMDREDGDPLQ